MENLKQLEKIIHEFIPELLDLSFGCEVKQFDGIRVLAESWKVSPTQNPKEEGTYYERPNERGNTSIAIFDEILGRPIQLHHILRAVALSANTDGFASDVCYNTQDNSQTLFMKSLITHDYTHWDLNKDLKGQSAGTVKFLLELLK